MLLYGCLYIGVSGPFIQYLKTFKKFRRGAELQPLRASPTMSFPQRCRFLEAGQGGGWGCEQLTAIMHLCLKWMHRNGEAHTAFGRVLKIF